MWVSFPDPGIKRVRGRAVVSERNKIRSPAITGLIADVLIFVFVKRLANSHANDYEDIGWRERERKNSGQKDGIGFSKKRYANFYFTNSTIPNV